ncbi:MAG: hypothetical protein ACOC1P_03075 [Minisyncoccales bacterium]
MDFDFEKRGPVDYIVHCYEKIPKQDVDHRAFFLELFLEQRFRDCTGKRYIPGGRSYVANGKETLDKMLNETVEKLEPVFYDIMENELGYKRDKE